LISAMGHLSGNQLRNTGIDIILGPVLDIYNVKQDNRGTLQDRCFAASTEGVVYISSHYIKGLHESEIAIFAKRFLSYGSVETNPHQLVMPIYDGAPETLSRGIDILSKLEILLQLPAVQIKIYAK